VRCSVLQCDAVCCSVLQCVAVRVVDILKSQRAVCCIVLHCIAVCSTVEERARVAYECNGCSTLFIINV